MSKVFWAVLLGGLLGLAGTIYYSIDAENPQDFELLGRLMIVVAVIGAGGVFATRLIQLPVFRPMVSAFLEREDDDTKGREQGLGDRVGWALVWFGGTGLVLASSAIAVLGSSPAFMLFAKVALVAGLAGVACFAVLWVSRASEVENSVVAQARQNLQHQSISSPQVRLAAAAVAILGLFLGGYWVYSQMQETRQAVGRFAVNNCLDFINREFNSNSRSNPAFIDDTWNKNGSIVVSVGWKETRSSSTYQTRLCVYDPERGKMSSPGALGRGRWER